MQQATSFVRGALALFLALAGAAAARADQVTLKNGDRITGAVVKYDGKNLVIKSDLAGDVTIPWENVTAVNSSNPLYVGLKNSQTVLGTLTTTDNKVEVATKEAGKVDTTRESVLSIRNASEQQAYETEIERYRNPRLVDLWAGFVDLGYSQTGGNAQTNNIAVSANANRATSRDKIGVTFTSLFASSNINGKKINTANAIRGGIAYNLNLSPKAYVFAATDLEYDEFQGLDLRFAPNGGIGYHIITNPKTTFDFLGGAGVNREFFTNGLNRTSGEALLGEELVHKISERTTFREKLVFFPNLTHGGDYRMNFDLGMATALRRWLSWQLTFSDRYLSNPIAGRKGNDTIFTTGFRMTFAK
jgi:putative salt-induced outer membrane protein YdiY